MTKVGWAPRGCLDIFGERHPTYLSRMFFDVSGGGAAGGLWATLGPRPVCVSTLKTDKFEENVYHHSITLGLYVYHHSITFDIRCELD